MVNWTGLKTNKLLSVKDANDQIAAQRAKLTQKYINAANELLDRDNAAAFLTEGRISTNSGIFKKRKNIDEATRELLGQIQALLPTYVLLQQSVQGVRVEMEDITWE
jgi:hypothetical protein